MQQALEQGAKDTEAAGLGESPVSELTISPSNSSIVSSPPGSTVMSPKGSAVREDIMDMEESFLPLHDATSSPLMARSLPLFDALPAGTYNLNAGPSLTDSPTPTNVLPFTSSSYEVRTLRRSDDVLPDPLLSPTEPARRMTTSATNSPARSRSHSKSSAAHVQASKPISSSMDVTLHLARTKTPRGRSQSRKKTSASPTGPLSPNTNSRRTSRSFSPLPEIHHVRSPPKSVGPYVCSSLLAPLLPLSFF